MLGRNCPMKAEVSGPLSQPLGTSVLFCVPVNGQLWAPRVPGPPVCSDHMCVRVSTFFLLVQCPQGPTLVQDVRVPSFSRQE